MSFSPAKVQRSDVKQDVKSGVATLRVAIPSREPMLMDNLPTRKPALFRQTGFVKQPFSNTSINASSETSSDEGEEEEDGDEDDDCDSGEVCLCSDGTCAACCHAQLDAKDAFHNGDLPSTLLGLSSYQILNDLLHLRNECTDEKCSGRWLHLEAKSIEIDDDDQYECIASWLSKMSNQSKCQACSSTLYYVSEYLGSPGFP